MGHRRWLRLAQVFWSTTRACAFDDVHDVHKASCLASYEKHVALIRERVPPAQLLDYRVEQGWEPLCKFLEVPVPDVPFPRSWSSDDVKAFVDRIWWSVYISRAVIAILLAAVMALLMWCRGRSRHVKQS